MEVIIENRIGEALQQAVEKTFSEMAFIDVMEPESVPSEMVYGQLVHISFTRPLIGDMVLYLPSACKKMVVEG